MHGAFAQAHVTVMQLGVVQEIFPEGPIHVWAVQMKLEPVQVRMCVILERHKMKCSTSFQLRGLGQLGMLGELAPGHVIVTPLGLE